MAAPTATPASPSSEIGRVEDALVAELVRQAQRDGERAAEAAGDADVLADAEDARVAPHLLADGLAHGLGNAHLGHRTPPRLP